MWFYVWFSVVQITTCTNDLFLNSLFKFACGFVVFLVFVSVSDVFVERMTSKEFSGTNIFWVCRPMQNIFVMPNINASFDKMKR